MPDVSRARTSAPSVTVVTIEGEGNAGMRLALLCEVVLRVLIHPSTLFWYSSVVPLQQTDLTITSFAIDSLVANRQAFDAMLVGGAVLAVGGVWVPPLHRSTK